MEGENQTFAADPGMSAFVQNQQIMQQIVREMRETSDAVNSTEQARDVAALQKVEFPDEGGVLTWMEGHKYPYKGFPYHEFVDRIDMMKKFSRGFLSSLFHSFKGTNRMWLITPLPSFWAVKYFVKAWVYIFYRTVERFKIKPVRYSRSVRELHHAFTFDENEETVADLRYREQVRDLVCMFLEFDNAYRFRFQDVMEDFDPEHKDAIGEFLRLLGIMAEREKTQEIKDSWRLISLFVRFYLRRDKKLAKILAGVMKRINPANAMMDDSDRYYCEKRKDYHFKHYVSNRVLSQSGTFAAN